jgi:predicted  nucleic acid-binding Zn-ribbon protein
MTNTNYPSPTPTTQSQTPKNKNTKNIIIGILAIGLLGSWAYLLIEKSKAKKTETSQLATITKVTDEKSELEANFNSSLARLDSITGANNNLQGEKTALQKDIEARKVEIRKILNDKNASQAQLAKAKTMIAELNSKISGYEAEITRLNGENQILNVANNTLSQEKSNLETNLATKNAEKEVLEKTVDVASTFSASNIKVIPVDEKRSGKEKTQSTAKKVDKLVVSFEVENRIAKTGPADMYLIVTAPDGKIISESGVLNTRTDGDKNFTAKIPVEFVQGQRKPVEFPIRKDDFQTGDYKIEIYHNGFKIGEGVRSLKKGGLFS